MCEYCILQKKTIEDNLNDTITWSWHGISTSSIKFRHMLLVLWKIVIHYKILKIYTGDLYLMHKQSN